jgi:hypothetical protein
MRVLLALVLQWYGGTGAAAMQKTREVWRPPMLCVSACAWTAAVSDKVCIPRKAVFKFHGWSDPGTGELMPLANQVWVANLPIALQGIAAERWIGKDLVTVTGAELIALGKKACKGS